MKARSDPDDVPVSTTPLLATAHGGLRMDSGRALDHQHESRAATRDAGHLYAQGSRDGTLAITRARTARSR